jgi:long-chain acyl-CoA synthetase
MRTMLASLRGGASLFPLPRFDRQLVAETVEKHKISLFIAVPFMFGILAKTRFARPPDFSSLRFCISASAPMPLEANHEFSHRFGIMVRQLYGSTETGTISVNLSPDIRASLNSVGLPLEGVEVLVMDERGSVLGPKAAGELAVRSPGAIQQYVGDPTANRGAFRDGFFMTGDIGEMDAQGRLYLKGRKKFLINKGGYKINPAEIEELLGSHPKVAEVAVLGVPTAFEDEKVKAVVVLREPCEETELISHCQGQLADFKIPSLIEFREQLPKSATGKIRKQLLV